MIEPAWLGLGVALPMVLGAIGALLPGRAIGWAVGVTLAMVVGYWARWGLPRVPPNEAHQWLVLVGVPGVAVAAVVANRMRLQPRMPWVVRGLVAAGLPPLLLQANLWHRWSVATTAAWLTGLTAVTLLCWWAAQRAVRRLDGRSMPTALGLTAAATSAATLLTYSLTLAQWMATLAAVLLAGGLVVMALRLRHGLSGAVDVALPLTVAMVILARFHSPAMGNVPAALLLAAPLVAAWIHWVSGPGGRWVPGVLRRPVEAARLVAALVPAATAAGLTLAQWLAAQ